MDGWQTENPVWMEEREAIWNKYEIRLRDQAFMLGEGKTRLKQWRTYYLTGKLSKNSKLELIDRLWMHAGQNEEVWRKICEQVRIGSILDTINYLMNRSRDGYMEGIDGPLLQFLLGKEIKKGIIRFKDERIVTEQAVFFDKWRRRAFLWLEESFETDDCFCSYTIDFFFALLNHMPAAYFGLDIKTRHEVNLDRALMKIQSERSQCHRLFYFIIWFVEPRGLKGEDTPVRRFAEVMRHELDTRELPAHVKELWEYLKTDEARYLHTDCAEKNSSAIDYWALVHHQSHPVEDPLHYIQSIHNTYERLEFAQTPFDPSKVETVELNKHLSARFVKILGFAKGDSIPGYRYRIDTNSNFVNSPSQNDSINIDVIVFFPHGDHTFTENSPVAMMVPRPAKNYDSKGKYSYRFTIYKMNYRLVWRTLDAHHDICFKRYEKFESEEEYRWKYNAEPNIDVSYFPLKSGPKALLDTPKKDFPILKDSPLPPLV